MNSTIEDIILKIMSDKYLCEQYQQEYSNPDYQDIKFKVISENINLNNTYKNDKKI